MIKVNIKTKVVHSQTKPAWNVVGTNLWGKYKIARVPYVAYSNSEHKKLEEKHCLEAFNIAEFISYCFNNEDLIKTKNK